MDENSEVLRYSSKLKHRNECVFDEEKDKEREGE